MSIPAFRVEVEPPENEMPGKIKLEFLVPYMWFGFFRPPSAYMPRGMNSKYKRAYKLDVITKFCDMIAKEIDSAWVEK